MRQYWESVSALRWEIGWRGGVRTYDLIVAVDGFGSAYALGEHLSGEDPITWAPPRPFRPATLTMGSAWASLDPRYVVLENRAAVVGGTTTHRIIGLADVRVRNQVVPGCVVVETADADGFVFRRSYHAPGVGIVLERFLGDPEHCLVLDDWSAPH